jgi:hypothetical protein
MQKWNGRLDRKVDQIGWGVFILFVGSLLLAQNQGWIKSDGWSYFAIGLGVIMIVGGLVRLIAGHFNRWSGSGGLITGLAILYIGVSFLYGFGDWWALALILVGIGCLVSALPGQNKSACEETVKSN